MTDLSVVIPTRDRPHLLADCLQTLVAQHTNASVEVLVVDDGSRDALEPLVARFHADTISFRTLRLHGNGLNVGRNRGVEATSADIIAFLDDDTLVAPEWADAVINAFRSLGCAGVAGRILLQYEAPRPAWLWIDEHGYLSGLDHGDHTQLLPRTSVPVGANCAVAREWFRRVEGFTVGLDREGGSLISGGDTDFFRRIVLAGGTIGYEPRACVRHRVPPNRLTIRFFIQRGLSQGLTEALMEGKPTTLGETTRFWFVTLRQLARWPLILGKNLLLRRGLLAPTTWLARCAGRISVLRYR